VTVETQAAMRDTRPVRARSRRALATAPAQVGSEDRSDGCHVLAHRR
jgi:hypothetical protein